MTLLCLQKQDLLQYGSTLRTDEGLPVSLADLPLHGLGSRAAPTIDSFSFQVLLNPGSDICSFSMEHQSD